MTGAGSVVQRRSTSLRDRTSAVTLAIAEREARRLGITRVTEITRLDRIGIPVFASVRPRGALLQVHAGKGLTAIDARLGALMEAIEYAVTELQGSHVREVTMKLQEIVDQFAGLNWVDFAPPLGKPISLRRRVGAVRCEALGRRRSAWMPSELVFAPYRYRSFRPIFGWSMNGVASGNTVEEASLHALFEVLERDALALHSALDTSRWITSGSLPSRFRTLARRWRNDGVTLAVRDLPNVFGLPCFAAYLFEAHGDGARLAAGTGLHADRAIALSRAVCEAAQSRLSLIHGGRDDLTRLYRHDAATRRAREDVIVARILDRSSRASLGDVPHVPLRGRSIGECLDETVARLKNLGFVNVLRYRFRRGLGGLHVVRIIVPVARRPASPSLAWVRGS